MMTPRLPGQAPSPEQERLIASIADYWRGVGNKAPVQALTRVEGAAKQLIGLSTAIQGVYFAVFAFSDLRRQVESIGLPFPGGLIVLLFLLPVVLWLLSLFCATRVFVPQVRPGVNLNDVSTGVWQDIKDTYEKTVDEKLRWLRRSHLLLVSSFAVVLFVLVAVMLLPSPQPGLIPIIIVTPTPVITPTPTP